MGSSSSAVEQKRSSTEGGTGYKTIQMRNAAGNATTIASTVTPGATIMVTTANNPTSKGIILTGSFSVAAESFGQVILSCSAACALASTSR